jgi:hypothetical protein
MGNITRNGKAYDAADVTIELLGNTPNEVYELKYATETADKLNYSLGSNKPSSWSKGQESHSASITLSMADTAAIENAARKAGLSKITDIPPFAIVVSFFNEFGDRVLDRIMCKFMSTGRDMAQGGQALQYQHNLMVLDIKYNQQLGALNL